MTNFETKGGVVTQGETFAKLIHHLDEVSDCAATLAHLTRAQSSTRKDAALADGWIAVVELLKRIRHQLTQLAQGRLQ